MKFLLVSDSKLKITITNKEMNEYSIDPETVDHFNSASRRGFWRVLELARSRVGFDVSGDKVLIQFYPINSGECEVFVTKLGILSPRNANLVSRSDRVNTLERRCGYYAFDTWEDLMRVAREIAALTHVDSSLYSLPDGKLILSVLEYKTGGEHAEFPILTEYSRRLSADFEGYLIEHSEVLIRDNAIEKLAAGFTC
ncbi:MAG: adaptor protein MecA [Clostridia bacterium]|nr:adaptor protein MecA [Clostridia bacterium]